MDHFDWPVVDALADDLRIKPADDGSAIVIRQRRSDRRRPVEMNPPTTPGPEEEFHKALDVTEVFHSRQRMLLRQHDGLVTKHRTIGLFERQPDGSRHTRRARRGPKRAVVQDRREEIGVEDGANFGVDLNRIAHAWAEE